MDNYRLCLQLELLLLKTIYVARNQIHTLRYSGIRCNECYGQGAF
jgi:hypothetical protein